MKILVTGGTGFIGTRLVDKLIELGHDVVILDNKEGKINKKSKYVKGDIGKKIDIEKAIKDCRVVFHLAALVDARGKDKDEMFKINFTGAKNVFSAAIKNRCKIIFTSTAAVYGDAYLAKEDTPCKPLSYYGRSKLESEKLLDKNSFIVRLFNVYGPGGKVAMNSFCKNVIENKPVNIYGDGKQTRDFVYVSDVVEALILGMRNNGIYNVGSGTEITVKELIEKIEKISGEKAKLNYLPANKQEIKKSRADITRIKKLGWKPKVSLEEGIRNILKDKSNKLD